MKDYLSHYRPCLARQGKRADAETQTADEADLKHVHSLLAIPESKWESIIISEGLVQNDKKPRPSKMEMIFRYKTPAGGWATPSLTWGRLRLAYNASKFNKALFLTEMGDGMADFGSRLDFATYKYTGYHINQTQLRRIVSTEAVQNGYTNVFLCAKLKCPYACLRFLQTPLGTCKKWL